MKIKIITVGTPHLSFAKQGIEEYNKRISRFADVDIIHVKENKDTDKKILNYINTDFCILLDETGKQHSSRSLADFLEKQKNQSQNISIIVGGPDGHSETIRNKSNYMWSLSKLTFPHDIATMLVCETLYRSLTINAAHPYHRD